MLVTVWFSFEGDLGTFAVWRLSSVFVLLLLGLDIGRFRLVAGRGIVVDNYVQEDGDGKINKYK